jgi:hypothetical protein
MQELKKLDGERYVGDTSAMVVHDRWDSDCEDCLMEDVIARGAAVAFEPDTLDQALEEGFDCCDECFGKTDPPRPDWAQD